MAGLILNKPSAAAYVSNPRVKILVDGIPLPGIEKISVTQTNNFTADNFSAAQMLYADQIYGLSWWDQRTDIMCDIQIAPIDGGAFTSIFTGIHEREDIDIDAGTVSMQGRDLSSRFIDSKTQTAFPNMTSSQIVQQLAANHQMTANVDATTTPASRYFADDHMLNTNGEFSRTQTEWDLIVSLAKYEGYNVWVSGTTLNFKTSIDDDPNPDIWIVNAPPITFQNGAALIGSSNAIDLKLTRNRTLARDIRVEVRSWHAGNGKGFLKVSTASGTHASGSKQAPEKPQVYQFTKPNLTEDQAQKLADNLRASITKQERVIEWSEPGDITLTPRTAVRLTGTNSSYDGRYFIESISHSLSVGEGWMMHVRAKNHSTRTQAQQQNG